MKRRVLIVDDDSEIRSVLVEFLSAADWEVLEATNGLEALLAVKRRAPSAIVLDLSMPRLGGIDALKRIHAFNPAIRVVVFSGVLDPDTEHAVLAAGAVAALAKPGDLDELARLLGGGAPAAAAPHVPAVAEAPEPPTATPADWAVEVLLVDDEAGANELLAELLAVRGATVTAVTSAADALRMLAQRPVDVVFLDISMPGLTGIDALPAIRALAPDARVVMVSGLHDDASAKQAFARGAFDYIVKPIDIVYLARTMDTIAAMAAHRL